MATYIAITPDYQLTKLTSIKAVVAYLQENDYTLSDGSIPTFDVLAKHLKRRDYISVHSSEDRSQTTPFWALQVAKL